MKHAFISRHASEYPVVLLCRVLGVSRSGFYAAATRPVSAHGQADARLAGAITEAHAMSRGTYGAPRIHADLQASGLRTSRKRVARLMQQAGLGGAAARRMRRPRSPRLSRPAAVDLVERRFGVSMPGRIWCADATQVWTDQGWLCVSAVLDLGSRRIVGHACSNTATSEAARRALVSALARRRPGAGLIHHSDRGAAYRSESFQAVLAAHGVRPSMSRPGTPLDNAAMESFLSTLKAELVERERFATRSEAQRAIFEYIEVFYNRQRRHSSLGFVSPAAYEAALIPSPEVSTKVG